ncbi:MFS transporter [Bacillus subtilis]|uniref:MFS transporter n=1 Tax=Bacillus subtilis TaxID=1423 RepID=UPI000FFB1E85|nr:MFS transporter [Bacillus subtilis]
MVFYINMKNNFLKFILSFSFSTLSDTLYIVVATTYIYFLTDSLTLASLPVVLAMIAFSGGSFFVGWFLSLTSNLKKLYLISSIIKLVLLLMFFIVLYINNLSLYFLVITLIPFTSGINQSLNYSIIPIVEDDNVKGNSTLTITRNLINLIAWSSGGMLVSLLNYNYVTIISIILLLLSIIIFSTLDKNKLYLANYQPKKQKKNSKSILKLILKNKKLKMLFISEVFFLLGGGIWTSSFILAYVINVLHRNEVWWGYLTATFLCGSIIGGLVVLRLNNFLKKRLLFSLLIASIFYSVVVLGYILNSSFFIAALLFLLFGVPTNLKEVAQVTIIQNNAGNTENKVKLFSLYNVMDSVIHAGSIVILGRIADLYGIVSSFGLSFVLCSVGLLIMLIYYPKINLDDHEKSTTNYTI